MAKSGPTYKELTASLKHKPFLPVYLLHGEEEFLLDMGLTGILDAVIPPDFRPLNLDVVGCGEVDSRDIVARASSLPMMGDMRVVVAKNVERLSERDLELLGRYVESPSETTTLVLAGRKADLRRKPFSTLNARGAAFEFAPLKDAKIPSWIADRVKLKGASIDEEAAELFSTYVGSSLREIESEIEKLLTYLGTRKNVTQDDVANVIGFSREYTIFQLQDNIGKGNVRQALIILDHMLDDGQTLPYFIRMLTTYFSSLWRLHHLTRRGVQETRDPSEFPKAWNWKRDEYLAALRLYPSERIERAFRLLAETELASRQTSSVEDRDLLHAMLVQVMEGFPSAA
jgi:DNA polymerase-3 subunit delta